MLSVRLICVGKLGEKFWADAVKEYEKRLGAYCRLEIVELPEARLPQAPSAGEVRQALEKEAGLIEEKLPQGRRWLHCVWRDGRCRPNSLPTIWGG